MPDIFETEVAPASSVPSDPAAQSMRFMLVQDQLRVLAERVNLLAGMGLSHTDGYKDTFESYEAKLGDYTALKQAMGL